MLICVLSPFRASATRTAERHASFAKELCRRVSLSGHDPFASHLFGPAFLDDAIPEERAAGIRISTTMIQRCDAVWVWDLWGISAGMKHEIAAAVKEMQYRLGTERMELSIRYANEIPEWADLLEVK